MAAIVFQVKEGLLLFAAWLYTIIQQEVYEPVSHAFNAADLANSSLARSSGGKLSYSHCWKREGGCSSAPNDNPAYIFSSLNLKISFYFIWNGHWQVLAALIVDNPHSQKYI